MDERELAALVEKARERLMSREAYKFVSEWGVLMSAPGEAALVFLTLIGALGGVVSLSSHFFGIEVPSNPFILLIVPALWYGWLESKVFWGNMDRARQGPLWEHAPATIVAKTYCTTFPPYDEHIPAPDELWPAMRRVWVEGEARAFGYLADPQLGPFERLEAVENSSDKESTDDSPRKQG